MKDDTVFYVTISGGIGVLLSYVFLYLEGYITIMNKKFTSLERKLWSLSVLLTIVSFLGIIIYYSFIEKIKGDYRDLFIISLVIFLISATSWSVISAYIIKYRRDTNLQLSTLLITALACIGILVAIAYDTESPWLITAGSILVFHHLFFDSIYWPVINKRKS